MSRGINPKVLYYVWLALFAILAFNVLLLLLPFITTILLALIFGMLLHPVHMKVKKWVGKSSTSAILVILASILVIFIPLVFVGASLAEQATVVSQNVLTTNYGAQAEALLSQVGIQVNVETEVARLVSRVRASIVENLTNILSALGNMLVNVFIIFFLMYYIFTKHDSIVEFIKHYMPFKEERKHHCIKENAQLIKAVVYGMGLTALVQGFLGGVGFFIFGVPGPLFWGFVMALLSLIPLVGSWLVWAPASVFLILEGSFGRGIGLAIWGVIVVSQSDNIIRPYITKKLGNVHPIIVILGVVAGLAWNGFVGIITGPIILGIFVIMFNYLIDERSFAILQRQPENKTPLALRASRKLRPKKNPKKPLS